MIYTGTSPGLLHKPKRCFEEALVSDSTNAEGWYRLGKAGGGSVRGLSRTKLVWTDKECYEEALRRDSTHVEALKALAPLNKRHAQEQRQAEKHASTGEKS